MNKSLALIPVMFAIVALMVSPTVMSVSADPENSNGNGSDNAHPNECANSQGNAKQKNPNCTDGGGSSDQFTICDSVDMDGGIDADEIVLWYNGDGNGNPLTIGKTQSTSWIFEINLEQRSDDETEHISNSFELGMLNDILAEHGVAPCE